jgi:hypothetical protein
MNYLDYVIVLGYLMGFLGLGYFFKNNKNSKDYFLGGNSLGWFSPEFVDHGHPIIGHQLYFCTCFCWP